jgi:Fe2+ transport system protein FeoA
MNAQLTDEVETYPMASHDTIQLSDLAIGERGTVIKLGNGSGSVMRMAALGFTPGASVSVVRNYGRGPLIVSVLDTQIALGRGQASQVCVRREG